MKNTSLFVALVATSTLLLAGCWNKTATNPSTTGAVDTGTVVETGMAETGTVDTGAMDTGAAVVIDRTVSIDSTKSTLEWMGKKIGGTHTGTITIASGALGLSKNMPAMGMFTIDMTTITPSQKDMDKLVTHLKSEDFFNVSGYNTATLKLMKVTVDTGNTYTVVAALTIKGITQAITFPAIIDVTAEQVTAKASFAIDRTKWNIKYGSASIFSDIGDKAIDDKIEFVVNAVLK